MQALAIFLSIFISGKTVASSLTSGNPPDSLAVRWAISMVNSVYGEAYIKGDSALFLSCYSEDASILPANSPSLSGSANILAFFKFGYKMGVRNIVFTTAGLFGLTKQFVTEQGNYEMFDANSRSIGKGKYLVLWKRTPAGWKMFRDMFNSDVPAGRAPNKDQ
jgi:ketosteroid isomerase-like protein